MKKEGRKGLIPVLVAVGMFLCVLALTGTAIVWMKQETKESVTTELAIQRGTPQAQPLVVTGGVPSGECAGGTQIAISGGGKDAISSAGADVNFALFTVDDPLDADMLDEEQTGETRANAAITSISTTFPIKRAAYAVVGNGDTEWTTDRGTDYYTRRIDFTSGCSAKALGFVELYAESNVTYDFFDNRASESVANITIGSGGTYTKASFTIEADDNEYIGSPDYYKPAEGKYPIGFCFNESTAGDFEYIKPKNYVRTFTPPQFLTGLNVVGQCYEIAMDVVKDQGISADIPIVLKANSGKNPANVHVYAMLMDKCAGIGDNKVWEFGIWGDDSVEGTDYDCGINGRNVAIGGALDIFVV